jgi:hypothetical protein
MKRCQYNSNFFTSLAETSVSTTYTSTLCQLQLHAGSTLRCYHWNLTVEWYESPVLISRLRPNVFTSLVLLCLMKGTRFSSSLAALPTHQPTISLSHRWCRKHHIITSSKKAPITYCTFLFEVYSPSLNLTSLFNSLSKFYYWETRWSSWTLSKPCPVLVQWSEQLSGSYVFHFPSSL